MFYREINKDIKVSLSVPKYADELFKLTDKNREYLRQWLPWIDYNQKSGDTKDFIKMQLSKFHKEEALNATIFYKNSIAGVVGFNVIDQRNGIGYVGYWLGEEYTGKGIMTLAVKDLIKLGFEFYDIKKADIRCATVNKKSIAIPERLGFQKEGVIRKAEKVYENQYDHVVYGMLKSEFQC